MADKRVKRAPARIFTVKIPFLWLTRAGSPILPQIFTVKIPLPMANKSGESDPATNFHGENPLSYG